MIEYLFTRFDAHQLCSNVICNVFVLNEYPKHLLDLPHLSEYRNSGEQPYIKKTLRPKAVEEDLLASGVSV